MAPLKYDMCPVFSVHGQVMAEFYALPEIWIEKKNVFAICGKSDRSICNYAEKLRPFSYLTDRIFPLLISTITVSIISSLSYISTVRNHFVWLISFT